MIIKSTRNNTTLFVKGFLFNLDDSGAWYHHGRRYSFDLLERLASAGIGTRP